MQTVTLYSIVIAAAMGCLFWASDMQAQIMPKKRAMTLSVSNVGTQLPEKLITSPVHLGITAGAEFHYNRSTQNEFFQTAKVGFLYHRYVQRSLQLYSEFGYRRKIIKGFGAEIRAGGGYLHSFPGIEVFKLKDGVYQKKTNLGRPQGMAGAAFGLGYQLPNPEKAWRFFVDYQFFVQTPFVKEYVALLPSTALHLGVSAPFSIFKK